MYNLHAMSRLHVTLPGGKWFLTWQQYALLSAPTANMWVNVTPQRNITETVGRGFTLEQDTSLQCVASVCGTQDWRGAPSEPGYQTSQMPTLHMSHMRFPWSANSCTCGKLHVSDKVSTVADLITVINTSGWLYSVYCYLLKHCKLQIPLLCYTEKRGIADK